MSLKREPHWQAASQKCWQLPRTLTPWLLDEGSLTARLIEHSEGRFSVKVLFQGWGPAHPSEQKLLQCSGRTRVLVREVILMGAGAPWVFARSLVPCTSLNGRLKALKHLNDRPLGALLFQDPGMQRGPIEVACINHAHSYIHSAVELAEDFSLWGRRSLFYMDQNPLLVSEVFLPDFLATV